MNAEWRKWQITDVGFYYDLNGNGNPYEDQEKLKWDGNDPSNPQPGEFTILRQQPEGNVLFILAHISSPDPPPSNAKVVVMLKTSVTDQKGIKVTLHYSGACPQGNGYHFHKPYGQEIKMVKPPEQSIDDIQIQVHVSGDNTAEVTTYDHAISPTSNYLDSAAIEVGLTNRQKRGRARDSNWEMKTPTLPTLLRFIQAAGVEKIKVYDPHNPSVNHELPVKNQADILYYSGHGSIETGELISVFDSGGTIHPSEINAAINWGEDLEYFIISACGVLDPDSKGISYWAKPIVKNGPLKGLTGYYGSAPQDIPPPGKPSSVEVADRFVTNLNSNPSYDFDTGDSVLNAWLESNAYYQLPAVAYTNWWVVEAFEGWWVVKEKQQNY